MNMRNVMIWSMIIFGVLSLLSALGLVHIVWLGGWGVATFGQRLDILGSALTWCLAGFAITIGALTIGGPVGNIKINTKAGSAEVNGDDE